MSKLTFQPRSLILESQQHIKTVFSEATRPIELKFHMTTPYDWLPKIYTNCDGHMTKMAITSIYGKRSLHIFCSGTKTLMALGLTM